MIIVKVTDFIGQYALAQSIAINPVIQSYIDREEKKLLYKLLGKELADLLIAYVAITKTTTTSGELVTGQTYKILTYNPGDDFTNVGATSNSTGVSFVATGTTPTVWTNLSELTNKVDRYENILNPFYEEASTSCGFGRFHESAGIKDLLLIQIYYCYLSEEQIKASQSGIVGASAENSTVQSPAQAYRKGEQKWNEAGIKTWWAIQWYCKYNLPDAYPEFNGAEERVRYSSII
jgi:hypothetical protein